MSIDETLANESIQEREESMRQRPQPALPWLREIVASEKHLEKFWITGDQVVKRFLDIREPGEEVLHRYNLFSTNTEILKSTIYAKIPEVTVEREFRDADDDVARVGAIMLERCILVRKFDEFDCALKQVVQDWLLPGIGNIWFRYEPTIVQEQMAEVTDPVTGAVLTQATTYDRLVNEEVISDYVYWKDFLFSPARTWKQVRWVARRLKFTKADAEKRFGKEKAGELKYTEAAVTGSADKSEPDYDSINQNIVRYAEVFELWDKISRKVYWVSKGVDNCIDCRDDPLKLLNFFPCPKPLMSLHSSSDMLPRADYLMVQDQYQELDLLNNRIVVLQRAVKVVGVYDGANEEVKRIFTEMIQSTIIPMTSFREFAEKGGFKGAIDWIPLEMIVKAIEALRSYRQELIAQIYELTGISDIMRGATKASETLGAQELKAQYGAVRIQDRQMTLARFVEEAMGIKAEIVRTKYQPETILSRSNIQYTPDGDIAPEAVKLLQDDLVLWRITVMPDTMAIPEFNSERDARMAYVRAIAEMLTAATPLVQQDPTMGPYLMKMMAWAAAGFRVGRTIEGVLDDAVAAMEANAKKPPEPPPPDPEVEKTKMEMQMAQEKHQMDMQSKQVDQQMKQQDQQMEQQAQAQQMHLDQQKMQMEFQMMQLKMEMELQKMEMELQKMRMELGMEQEKAQLDMEVAEASAEQKLRHEAMASEQKLATASAISENKIAQSKAEAKAKPKPTTARNNHG
jgi:hypothetical protein